MSLTVKITVKNYNGSPTQRMAFTLIDENDHYFVTAKTNRRGKCTLRVPQKHRNLRRVMVGFNGPPRTDLVYKREVNFPKSGTVTLEINLPHIYSEFRVPGWKPHLGSGIVV